MSLHYCACVLFSSDLLLFVFFFFNVTATTEIYTLSLHDALPISPPKVDLSKLDGRIFFEKKYSIAGVKFDLSSRSEEHTSELQSRRDLVCRLLLEKKKKNIPNTNTNPLDNDSFYSENFLTEMSPQ